LAWWSTLDEDQQAEICDHLDLLLPEWVLDSMAEAGIKLVLAEIGGNRRRLPPTITRDFLEQRHRERLAGRARSPGG